jgi:radical SAM protein with 4Fe4S-binding SPASM domain
MAGYNEQGAEFVEGNIRDHRLADIWHRPGAFAYNREWKLDSLSGFCRECRHARKCRGGCRAKVTAFGNGVENPMCIHRVAVEQGLYRHQRAPYAAAVIASSLLGMAGCRQAAATSEIEGADAYGVPFDDTATETLPNTGTGPADTGTGPTDTGPMDTGTGPADTDTGPADTGTGPADTGTGPVDTETWGIDEYGIFMDSDTQNLPDTEIETDTTFADAYGIPWDTDTGTGGETEDTDTASDLATEMYGILILDTDTTQPEDTSSAFDVPVYGMPDDAGVVVVNDTDTFGGVDVYGMPATERDGD